MTIYKVDTQNIRALERTTFREVGINERSDLQRLLRERIDVISPDTLIVAEELGGWEDSRRRIDLLGIDRNGNIVVIELKRTEDGGHMDLQAIRYAAMVSTLTFEHIEDIFGRYLAAQGKDGEDPKEILLEWLDWEEAGEADFAQDVRIVLASAEFNIEITTAVLWLNTRGLDIRCVRLEPYRHGDDVFLDVQQVVPLPEAAEYQVRVREKEQKEREQRRSGPDFTRYDLRIGGQSFDNQWKRRAIYQIVRYLIDHGVTPEQIKEVINWRRNRLFREMAGLVDSDALIAELQRIRSEGGLAFDRRRYFSADDELFHVNGKTYTLINQWGQRALEAIERLSKAFPEHQIQISPTNG